MLSASQFALRKTVMQRLRLSPWPVRAVTAACVVWFSADVAHAGDLDLARGWAALRAMDCARCHGREYSGWSAPSLLAAVRDGSRERFDWYVLQGDATRGMPGYRSQPLIVAELDAIYAYLRARSEGPIVNGLPALVPRAGDGSTTPLLCGSGCVNR